MSTTTKTALSSSKRLADQFTAPRLSVADRIAAGKRLRTVVPRASLAEYKPQPNRNDPIAILEAQAKSWLKDLVSVRHARMLTSPFAFFARLRGRDGAGPESIAGRWPSSPGLRLHACI